MRKQKLLEKFSTVEVGEACYLNQCCREIRLGAEAITGLKLTGWNTLSDEYEEWIVEVINHQDFGMSLVRRVK